MYGFYPFSMTSTCLPECPARSAMTLVFNRANNAILPPVFLQTTNKHTIREKDVGKNIQHLLRWIMRRKKEMEIVVDTVSGRTTSVSLWVPFVAEQFWEAPKRCAWNSSQLISANSIENIYTYINCLCRLYC